MLSARSSSPSARNTAASRRSRRSISAGGCHGRSPGLGTLCGAALALTTSCASTSPVQRRRNNCNSRCSSVSPRRSHLLSTSKVRLPTSARLRSTLNSLLRRSPSTTNRIRSASTASDRASRSRLLPCSPASRIPGYRATGSSARARPTAGGSCWCWWWSPSLPPPSPLGH